ncbi:MAG: hypothetical protein IKT32_00805 [Clostridia bacterium]|nr:hypothetical protein [Clostridia bacterium]
MVKVKQKQFNIFTFIVKAVLVLLSIAVSLFLFIVFEQKGIIIQFQSLLPKVEVSIPSSIPNLNMSFIEKEVGRFLSGVVFTFFLTRKSICLFFSIFAILYASLSMLASILLSITSKWFGGKKVKYEEGEKEFDLPKTPKVSYNDVVKTLNLTLTI